MTEKSEEGEEIGERVDSKKRELGHRIRTGLRVFIAITIITLLVILIWTAKRETWEALKRVELPFLVLAVSMWLVYVLFDGIRVQILSGALGTKIGLSAALKILLSGLFLAAVTPFQTGGFPVQLYLLKKEGISVGKGSLVLLFRGILELVIFILVIPFIWVLYRSLLTGPVVRVLVRYLLLVYVGYLVFLLSLLLIPRTLKKMGYGVALSLRRRRVVKTKKLLRGVRRLFLEVDEFRCGLKIYFSKRKLRLLGALFMTVVSFVGYFMFAPVILYGLGLHSPLARVIVLQVLLKYLLFFIPTPGASGVAEAGFVSLFYRICPEHLLGVYVILWRFFTFYLGASLGGVVVLRLLKTEGAKLRLE